jgi:mannose-6-phosphate isomerase-like protein (cupin superfamily)
MQAFHIEELINRRERAGRPYLEFLRVPAMSAGLYVLETHAEDHQPAHTEDEVYYILSGRGKIRVGTKDYPVEPGSIVYVPADVDHRFHSITERLTVLVFFAPAEYSQAS